MKQLGVLIVLSLAVLRIHAKLGTYYAHVCSGQTTNVHCPGDFLIAFNGLIYTQYSTNYTLCGTVSAYDTTGLAQCSSLISTESDNGPLAQSFKNQCLGKSECVLKLNFDQAVSGKCNSTNTRDLVRVMYSCLLTTGKDETVVCSDPQTGKATTQFLACPSNRVIQIDKIQAQSTENGSMCNDYIGPNDFETPCTYVLGPSHDFYQLVVDTCSGWTACTVKGTLIENPQSNKECARKAERNFQRIYYSCVPDTNLKTTLCSEDLPSQNPHRITCDGSYIKITNVVADRIYNLNPSACPVEDAVKNVAVFGCAVQVQELQFLDSFTRPCNGKSSCDVTTSKYLADPCGAENARTRNWFVISYQCTKTPETDGYRLARACNGSKLTLQCPAGAVLSFGSMYATVLFASGNKFGDYECNTSLTLGNSEVTSCTLLLSASGFGNATYKAVLMKCDGKNECSVPISNAVEGPECIDYSKALGSPRSYTHRQLYDVQYTCMTQPVSDTSSSESTPVNSVGLGLGLAALFLVLIGAIVAVVIYRRRNRDGMTTKMSSPSAGNNYSNF